MPCESSYLDQNFKEAEFQKAAQLLVYCYKKLNIHVSLALSKASKTFYCEDDYVPNLCALLKGLTPSELESVVYDAHDKTSRELADWWEEHQKADRLREANEMAARLTEEHRKKALAKLTVDERKSLGF